MSNDVNDFMTAMSEAYREQRRQQKSDDIIEFIKIHWNLFCSRKDEMRNALDMLGTSVPYTVDALCDQLSIPANVFFKRSPVRDIEGALLNFPDSKFLELFTSCCRTSKNGEVCLFIIAGKKSLVLTNMQTSFNPGDVVMYFKSMGELPDIHIFKVDDAPKRMPTLFDHKE